MNEINLDELRIDLENDINNNEINLSKTVNFETNFHVFGSGPNPQDKEIDIMFLGEAPGKNESEIGLPFVGKSGELIQKHLLDEYSIDRNDIFISNIMKIRPTMKGEYGIIKDRTPSIAEIRSHLPHTKRLIQCIKPKIIFCFGRIAATLASKDFCLDNCLTDHYNTYTLENVKKMKYMSIVYEQGNEKTCIIEGIDHVIKIIPMLHPSFILRINNKEHRDNQLSMWKESFYKGLNSFRTTDLMTVPIPLNTVDLSMKFVNKNIINSEYPSKSSRKYKWSGATIEEVENGEWKWNTPDDIFYERLETNIFDKNEKKLLLQCLSLDYDRGENYFKMFGRKENGQSVLCLINNFKFHMYFDIPESINQKILSRNDITTNEDNRYKNEFSLKFLQILKNLIISKVDQLQSKSYKNNNDNSNNSIEDIQLEFCDIPNLYSGYINPDSTNKHVIKFTFNDYNYNNIYIKAIKDLWFHKKDDIFTHFYETEFQPEYRFTYDTGIKACSWIEIDRNDLNWIENEDNKLSTCDLEFSCECNDIIAHDPSDPKYQHHSTQYVLGLDIECVSSLNEEEELKEESKPPKFPFPNRAAVLDICFTLQKQDEKMIASQDKGICKRNRHFVFTLRKCNPIEDAQVFCFKKETDMLKACMNFIQQVGPDYLVGHNVKNFDLYYIIKRLEILREIDNVKSFGKIKNTILSVKERKFKSRAFGERIILLFESNGVSIIDTFEIYIREKKYRSYKLQSIAKEVLGDTKNDMPYVSIPGFFWGDADNNKLVNEYCKKDASLTIQILNKGKWLNNIWEFCRACGAVYPGDLYTRGQQIKVLSCIVLEMTDNDRKPLYLLPTHPRQNDEEDQSGVEEIVETYYVDDTHNNLYDVDNDTIDDKDDDNNDEYEKEGVEYTDKVQKSISFLMNQGLKKLGKADDINFKNAAQKYIDSKKEILDISDKRRARFKSIDELRKYEKKILDERAERVERELEKITYQGATVLPPMLGFHIVAVICSDFASLYPSIMIADNISHDTKVFHSELESKGLTLDDVTPSLVESLPPKYKKKKFRDRHERAKYMEKYYFVKQERIRSIYGDQLKNKKIIKKLLYFDQNKNNKTIKIGENKDDHVIKVPDCLFNENNEKYNKEKEKEYKLKFEKICIGFWDWAKNRFKNCERVRNHGLYLAKEEKFGMGILPLTLVTLLERRKKVKLEMYLHEYFTAEFARCNGKQLSLKILANSTYGATGVSVGALADQDIGAAVTAKGRYSIELAKCRAEAKYRDEDNAFTRLVDDPSTTHCKGGDTDSYFETFGFAPSVEEAMEFGPRLVHETNKCFKLPMKLTFEKVMFKKIIIAKKRYTGLLFAGEDNQDFFEKKRWVELSFPKSEWESIFTQREKIKKEYKKDDWDNNIKGKQIKIEDIISEIYSIKENIDYDWYGNPVKTYSDVVNVEYYGGIGWWKNGQWKTKDEWHGYFNKEQKKWIPGILSIESKRRIDQTDDEWVKDYKRERYEGLEFDPLKMGRLFAKGIESVRRDSSLFVSNTMRTFLKTALLEGDIMKGLVYVHNRIKDLVEGKIDELELIMSKCLSKSNYATNKAPHTNLKERMKERGDVVPSLGERVHYLIIKGSKDKKMYERSEHPDRVIEHNLPLDYEYLLKTITKPMAKLINPLVENCDEIFFNHKRMTNKKFTNTVSASLDGNTSKLISIAEPCLICGYSRTKKSITLKIICTSCERVINNKTVENLLETHKKSYDIIKSNYNDTMEYCRKCTNTIDAPCNNFECSGNRYFKRKKIEREFKIASDKLEDIEELHKLFAIKENSMDIETKNNINIDYDEQEFYNNLTLDMMDIDQKKPPRKRQKMK